MNMYVPDYISDVLNILYNNGFEGYLVGGCVRDVMMGKTPHDFDLTTNALPKEMLSVFSSYRIIETGIKHGTVTVVSNGENVEITTYRIDGKYLDNRRPEEVTFTRNLHEDLSRRDFTVNALAYSPKDGLVDIFGGMTDLENRVIRCVGDADKRFNEDGLRIMRALRFSSVLDFDIEDETAKSIHRNKDLLKNISAERIYTELKKLVCGKRAKSIIREYTDVFETVFPMISDYVDKFVANAEKTDYLSQNPSLRLASLLFGFDNAVVRKFMNSLKSDNKSLFEVSELNLMSRQSIGCDKVSVRHLMGKYDSQFIEMLSELKKAYCNDFDYDEFMHCYNAQKEQNPCVSLKTMNFTGSDLISLGIERGPVIGDIMNKLLELVISDQCENDFEKLKTHAKKLIAENKNEN
ncbi:MAG: CCA tRNA nucleotidyltransferase [Clostridia bacterium]|nr:CCA tRNA nucleotidyltransferase [Clostridia bacterium]